MDFLHESRKYQERKIYNTENSCTETMQNFRFFLQNILFQKFKTWIFIWHMFIFLVKIMVQVKHIKCLWVDTITLTANAHVIMHKEVRYLVKKFTHNTSPVVSPFKWRELHLSTFKNWNHSPYPWKIFILVYLMKVIRMLTLLRHIFIFFFNLFLQKGW